MRLYLIIIVTLIININNALSENIVSGKVVDSKEGYALPGASIRIDGTDLGTYTSTYGKFRLPLPEGKNKIIIRSIGYKEKAMTVTGESKNIIIELEPRPVKLTEVEVAGDITPDQIIQRAVERKEENLDKINTFSGTLYSKLVVELGGSAFANAEADEASISIGGTLGGKAPESMKMFVLETFSKNYEDFEKNVNHTVITQRRQTANLQPDANLLRIRNFSSFYNESFELMGTELMSPLSEDAVGFYDFELRGREYFGDKYIYDLTFEPGSDLSPGFTGSMKIIEGTYELVEVDVRPSKTTAIPFLDSMHIFQKFEEFPRELWYPTYLEISGNARVDVIRGIIDVNARLTATSIYQDVVINEPLPDSIYTEEIRTVTVAEKADSADIDYWENNSLREISEREKEIYTQVDSLVKMEDSLEEHSSFEWDVLPWLRFNRVESLSLEVKPSMSYGPVSLNTSAFYSFGQEKFYGSATLSVRPFNFLSLQAGIFSNIETFGSKDSYPLIMNTLSSAFLHTDVFDYYRMDGFGAGFSTGKFGIKLAGEVDFERHFSLDKKIDRSLFTDKTWRRNPKVTPGNYKIAKLNLSYDTRSLSGISSKLHANINLNGTYGEEENGDAFRFADGNLSLTVPTFSTGYGPLSLEMTIAGGKGSGQPPQLQFRMNSWAWAIVPGGRFISSPVGFYGGKEYIAGYAEYNLTDLWWRAIGLPKYEGRGIDLLFTGASGRYFSDSNTPYYGTGDNYYSEIGFGLSRIPLFISNVFFLRFDARWGAGPIGTGNFGASLSGSFPF